MAHGTPDWGVTAGALTVYQMTDLGELAARLGSPDTHDRRGDVVWWDDFEWSLNKWQSSLYGTGSAAAISTVLARNGRCSALLTAGSDGSHAALLSHSNPYVVLSGMGAEASFDTPVYTGYVSVGLDVFNGTQLASFEIRVNYATQRLEYGDAAGGETVFATINVGADNGALFHTLKMVVDAALGTYVRAIFDNVEYDLTGIAGFSGAAVSTPLVALSLQNGGRAGQNDKVYVDDVILTQNEPV